MNSISVCIPTLNRYELLKELIASLQAGTLKPTDIWVIDNGQKLFADNELNFADDLGIYQHYRKFGYNLGCAASWNWFIQNTEGIRIICNDDIIFAPDALEHWLAAYDSSQIVCPDSLVGSNAFSAFTMPDEVVEKVGLFDEAISPNYAYLEDNDYAYRMKLFGMEIKSAPGVLLKHGESSTLKAFSPGQQQDHHRRFRQAQVNYFMKWGGLPGQEAYTEPYNGAKPES